jgi:hypothetical protein
MFKYVSDVSRLSHHIIKNFCSNYGVAVDATLGNGHDTDFLSSIFNKVYAFDIQKSAVENYSIKNNHKVILIHDSHANVQKHVREGVDCIVYNLGFLPGGCKSITTTCDSTIQSLNSCLYFLNTGAIITIAMYTGHDEGVNEEKAVRLWAESLPKNQYGVLLHSFINRTNTPPSLLVIEKK